MEKTLKLSLEISKEVTVREQMRVYTDKIPVSESEDKEISDKIDRGEYIINIKRKGIYSSEGERLYHVSIVDCCELMDKVIMGIKIEYDDFGNVIYYENEDGYWFKNKYDENNNHIYYENYYGVTLDYS